MQAILLIVVGLFVLLLSFWTGIEIGEGSILPIIVIVFITFILFYLSGASKLTFFPLVFIVLLNGHFNLGFRISGTEQFLLLTGMLFAITWWRRFDNTIYPSNLAIEKLRFVKFCLATWILFVTFHFIIHTTLYDEEGFRNILKSYVAVSAPYGMLLYIIVRPGILKIPKQYVKWYALLLLCVCGVSLLIRLYQTYFGMKIESFDPSEDGMAGSLFISFLRFEENTYALRTLSPLAIAGCITFLTSRNASLQSAKWRFVALCLGLLAIGGAFMSGGRATLVMCILVTLAILTLRGKRGALFISGCSFVLIIAFANLFSEWVNYKAPLQVSRSLQWVLLDKNPRVVADIENSSRWRKALAAKAIEEWGYDAKTRMIGWGFRGISSADYVVAGIAGANYTGVDEDFGHYISIKRVATHNLFTDLLVAFGIVGAAMYYILLLSFLVWSAAAYFRTSSQSIHKDFMLIAFSGLWSAAIFSNFAGSFLSVAVFLNLSILISAMCQHRDPEPEPRITSKEGHLPQLAVLPPVVVLEQNNILPR